MVKAAWGDVEANYQRRNDIIPNLIEVVKAYAKYEKETLQAVIEARARVGSNQMSKDMIGDPKAMAQFQAAQCEMNRMSKKCKEVTTDIGMIMVEMEGKQVIH